MSTNPFLLLQDGDAVDSLINKQNVAAVEKVKRKQSLANSKPKKSAVAKPAPSTQKPSAVAKPAVASVQKKQAPTAAPSAPEKKQESQPSKAQDKPKLSVKVSQKPSSAPPAGMDDLVIDKKAPRTAANAGPLHRVDVPVRDGKRQYERHSGTGRGTEMKKGGHGKGNWDTQVINPADIPAEKQEDEESAAAPAAEQVKPAEAAKQAPPPPEPVTMKEFLQKQAKKATPLPVAVPRQAGEGEDDNRWKQNFVPLVRTVPDELLEQEQHKKQHKKAKAETVSAATTTATTTDTKKEITKKHKAEKVTVNFTLPPIERAPPPPRYHDEEQLGDRRPPRSFNKEPQSGARPSDIKFAIHKTAGSVPTTGVTKADVVPTTTTTVAAPQAQPFEGRGRTKVPPVVENVKAAPPPQLTLEQFPALSKQGKLSKQARKEKQAIAPQVAVPAAPTDVTASTK